MRRVGKREQGCLRSRTKPDGDQGPASGCLYLTLPLVNWGNKKHRGHVRQSDQGEEGQRKEQGCPSTGGIVGMGRNNDGGYKLGLAGQNGHTEISEKSQPNKGSPEISLRERPYTAKCEAKYEAKKGGGFGRCREKFGGEGTWNTPKSNRGTDPNQQQKLIQTKQGKG